VKRFRFQKSHLRSSVNKTKFVQGRPWGMIPSPVILVRNILAQAAESMADFQKGRTDPYGPGI
jgi:hypothetical protein